MAQEDSAALEEYQALRAEILSQIDRGSSRLTITWAGVSALLATAAVVKAPELGCVALLLVCSGWVDELRRIDIMMQIGTYIRVILESQIEGLQWEGALNLIYRESRQKPRLLRRLLYSSFFTYQVFAVACIVFSFILYLEFGSSSLIRGALFWGLLIAGTIFSTGLFVESVSYSQKRRLVWDAVYSEFSEQFKFNAQADNC